MWKKILGGLFVLTVVLLGGLYITRNYLVERAIEAGSSYALGVDTKVSSATLNLGGGSLELEGMMVNNPEGYQATYFLTMARGVLDVEAGSVLDREVVIDSFVIEGVQLHLEQMGTNGNWRELLNNINQVEYESNSDSERRFRIRSVRMRDITVAGSLNLPGMKPQEKSFTLERVELSNVGGEDGATVGQVTSALVTRIINTAVSSGKLAFPEGFGLDGAGMQAQAEERVKQEVARYLR